MAQWLQEAGVSRFIVHIPAYGAPADARKQPAYLRAGKDQRGIRIGENLRIEILRVSQPPVRHGLYQRDAHQSLWAE